MESKPLKLYDLRMYKEYRRLVLPLEDEERERMEADITHSPCLNQFHVRFEAVNRNTKLPWSEYGSGLEPSIILTRPPLGSTRTLRTP